MLSDFTLVKEKYYVSEPGELFFVDAFSVEAGELGSSGHHFHTTASPQIAVSSPWITFITKC